MRHRLMVLATVLVIVGACGGGESDTVGEDQPGAPTTPPPATDTDDNGDGAADETEADDDAQAAEDAGLTVTIDGVTYQFEALECTVRENGALGGSGHTPDYSLDTGTGEQTGAILQFQIQVEGSPNQEAVGLLDSHYVQVFDGDRGIEWNAGSDPRPGYVTFEESYIDTWTLDGTSASGTAFFVDEAVLEQVENVVSVPGEFSFRCGD